VVVRLRRTTTNWFFNTHEECPDVSDDRPITKMETAKEADRSADSK
jgi:hypothetical protein